MQVKSLRIQVLAMKPMSYILFIFLIIALLSGCSVSQKPIDPMPIQRDKWGCSIPSQVVSLNNQGLNLEGLAIKDVAVGKLDYRSNPDLRVLLEKNSLNSIVAEYLLCGAMGRGEIDRNNQKQVNYLRTFLHFMSSGPNPNQIKEWQKENPFPDERKDRTTKTEVVLSQATVEEEKPASPLKRETPKFENQGIRIIVKSLRKEGNAIKAELIYRNLLDMGKPDISLYLLKCCGNNFYLADDEGEQWQLQSDSDFTKGSQFRFSPQINIRVPMTFSAAGVPSGKVFHLVMDHACGSNCDQVGGNTFRVIIKNIRAE